MMEIFAAPLQGLTDHIWRNTHSRVFAGCISRYYTPFLRIEKGAFRNKDLREITPANNTCRALVPQVIACPIEQVTQRIGRVASMGYR